jgi:TonB family protein
MPMRLLPLLAAAALVAQTPSPSSDPIPLGTGITPPRAVHIVKPVYSLEARRNAIQGTVLLEIVVDEKGAIADQTVISPLGFGLDEKAQAAAAAWRFEPARKDGRPVRVICTLQVNFELRGGSFPEIELARTEFNQHLRQLQSPTAAADRKADAEAVMRKLAARKFPPAMLLVGLWNLNGQHGPKDIPAGLELLEKAADADHPEALYQLARRHLDGQDLPADAAKGWKEMHAAARLGHRGAQFYLGSIYEKGGPLPANPARARDHFRLCAAQQVGQCQFRLGRLLLEQPNRRERDYVQAIAFLQLAAAANIDGAAALLAAESPKLTPDQVKWAESLNRELSRK